MNRIHACGLILLCLAATKVPAQDPPKVVHTLKDVAWFAGAWRSPGAERVIEEHWSEPAAGNMIGMFRLVNPGKSPLYEFLLMEETKDGVFMRLRHFKAEMAELEKVPIRLKLTKATQTKAVFENPDGVKPKRIYYTLSKADEMTVVVESTRDGKDVAFELRMSRVKK